MVIDMNRDFGLQVYKEDGTIERYNIFYVYMIIRHDKDGKKYLYDVINIKKRNEHPAWLLINNTYGKKPISCI